MSSIYPAVDPDGLLEYSVVFTDRSVNHMSQLFQETMRGLSTGLRSVYHAEQIALVPGGGTFAMESVARQFCRHQRVHVLRNGWFSFRWSQIFDAGVETTAVEVARAVADSDAADAQFVPAELESFLRAIQTDRPGCVIAPHVETSAGMLLPDETLKAIADATHAVGGLFILDCVASGCLWVDMAETGVDVLITAPQKGWSSSPCAGVVLLSARAAERLDATQSDSYALDLKKWRQIMAAYEHGGHAYHATMPTDGLIQFYRNYQEMAAIGFAELKSRQIILGQRMRGVLEAAGFKSLAGAGFQSPTVIVSHTDRDDFKNTQAFLAAGVQVAAGVPLECNESAAFKTFRVGLFGVDKLMNIDRTVANFETALSVVSQPSLA
ncbi:MAG: alanine--glyoxylate aminotransferase family protein [Gammaproteobacteria bacterium]|nr:alanine--glyoxylate aminotransferase family protein [Gammaproteobacteria bacterium]